MQPREGALGLQDGRPLQRVDELADVAGPGRALHDGAGVGGDRPGAAAGARGLGVEGLLRDGDDVLGALSQGRDEEREDGEPVVEVLAEATDRKNEP